MAPIEATQTLAKGASQEQDEIDEIMKEIKNLQESINSVQAQKPAAPKLRAVESPAAEAEADLEAELAELRGDDGFGEPSLEETMATMKGDPEAKTLFDEEPETAPTTSDDLEQEMAAAALPTQLSSADEELADAIEDMTEEVSSSAEEGSLTMTLTGKMSLKLKYAFDGNEVSVRFHDESLVVALTDGTELKIPLRRGPRRMS